MNYKDWEQQYKPVKAFDLEGYKQYVRTKYKELSLLISYNNNHIWTVLEENGKVVLKNDLHFHGYLGRIITEVPYKEGEKIVIEL